jgi:hypothetical protein
MKRRPHLNAPHWQLMLRAFQHIAPRAWLKTAAEWSRRSTSLDWVFAHTAPSKLAWLYCFHRSAVLRRAAAEQSARQGRISRSA